MLDDTYFMNEALKEARKSLIHDEVPVGAVIVAKNSIIARAHNQVEQLNDVTAHAEIIALTSAFHYLNSKYLPECRIYITLEPCVMCAGALNLAQIPHIIWAADDEKRGYSRYSAGIFHRKTTIVSGVMAEESEELLKEFFRKKRKMKD